MRVKGYAMCMVVLVIVCMIAGVTVAQIETGIIRDFSPGAGGYVRILEMDASSYLPEHKNIKYEPFYARDDKLQTAWCEGVKGDGIGEWIKFEIGDFNHPEGEIINVYRVMIVNGLAASNDLYYANNRVKKIQLEFSEGQKRVLELKDGVMDYQIFVVHTKAKWVRMKIVDVYKGKKYDDTCISEVEFETVTHPCDMDDDQRKAYMEGGDFYDVDPKKWGCE